MKKILSVILLCTILFGAMPTFAASDNVTILASEGFEGYAERIIVEHLTENLKRFSVLL